MQKLRAGFEGRYGAFGRIGRNPQTLQFEIRAFMCYGRRRACRSLAVSERGASLSAGASAGSVADFVFGGCQSARRAGSSDLSGIWAAFGEGGKPASVRTQYRGDDRYVKTNTYLCKGSDHSGW